MTLVASMDRAMWSDDQGHRHISALLGVPNLDDNPLNMSVVEPTNLLLRGFYSNRSQESGGQNGLESFLDVSLLWDLGDHSQGLPAGTIAGIVVGCVVGVAVILFAAALVYRRRRRFRAAAQGGKDVGNVKAKHLLPREFADAACRFSGDKDSENGGNNRGIAAKRSASGTVDATLVEGAGGSGVSSRHKSGPSQDIVQACRNLVLSKTANEPDELVLQSVLGEGSYGKVCLLAGLCLFCHASAVSGLRTVCQLVSRQYMHIQQSGEG